jgi:biopolymer transport protein ExbD
VAARTKGRKRRGDDRIPVDSFSDIAFLLIIFFILTSTFIKTMGFYARIPAGEQAEAQKGDNNHGVKMKGAEIYFDDKPLPLSELRKKLDKLNLDEAVGDKRVIMLEATDTTPYQAYYNVMAAIDAAGGVVALVEEQK